MANRAPLRDYLYVSTQKVERLTASLPKPAWKRLTALNVQAAGFGVGVSLADAAPATVIGVAAEVESVLRDLHQVHQVTDSALAVGHWFESRGLQMAYGAQAARGSMDSDAAVFVGDIDQHSTGAQSSVLLSGSAEFCWTGGERECRT